MKTTIKWMASVMCAAVALLFAGCDNSSPANEKDGNVKRITQADFNAEVIQSTNVVVADFYATWCGPCKMLAPMLERLAESSPEHIKFVKNRCG